MIPLIGITGRRVRSQVLSRMDARFAEQLSDLYFADYASALAAAGAVGVYLPFVAGAAGAGDIVERLDGLILTGGQDIHRSTLGEACETPDPDRDPRLDRSVPDLERDRSELALLAAAVRLDRPVLGVCRGMQLVNAAFGGTLIEHLGPRGPDSHNHDGPAPDRGPDWHRVRFTPGSTLAGIYGEDRITNSWHHQAVAAVGAEVRVVGRTPDGVAEALEVLGKDVLAVQWHPEWSPDPDPIFEWIVQAAQRVRTD